MFLRPLTIKEIENANKRDSIVTRREHLKLSEKHRLNKFICANFQKARASFVSGKPQTGYAIGARMPAFTKSPLKTIHSLGPSG